MIIKLLKQEGILEASGAIFYYDGFQFCAGGLHGVGQVYRR